MEDLLYEPQTPKGLLCIREGFASSCNANGYLARLDKIQRAHDKMNWDEKGF